MIHHASSEPFNLESEFVNDTDLVSSYEEATALVELSRSTGGSLTFPRVKPHTLGTIVAYAFSGGGTTAVDTIANLTNAYRHKMYPITTAYELSSFTMGEILIPGSIGWKYTGCMVDSFTLSSSRKDWWALDANIIGSGTRATNSGAITGSEESEPAMKAGDARIWHATSATGIDADASIAQSKSTDDLTGTAITAPYLNAIIQDFSWTFSNNIAADDLYEFNSGLVRARSERVRRSQTLSMTLEFLDATWVDYLTAGTQMAIEVESYGSQIGATAFYYGFNLLFPQLQVISATIQGGTDKLTVAVEFSVQQHSVDGSCAMHVYNYNAGGTLVAADYAGVSEGA